MYSAVHPINVPRLYPMEVKHHATPIDYTNLYIKNLDLGIESMDLFTYFRAFGKIISARVMKNPQTSQSRGFGFVSFSRMEDALRAKEEMDGQRINSKPISVAFHEPKKSTMYDSPVYPKRMREENHYGLPDKMNKYNHTMPLKRQISAPLFVPVYPELRRSGSNESMATTVTFTGTQLKRQAIMKAIFNVGEQEPNIQDVADMLLTLKKKDLATCLFNQAFLKAEIQRAKEALDLFGEEEKKKTKKHEHMLNIEIPPRRSRAIPIVAPTDAGVKKESDAKDLKDEVEKFLDTLKDLSLYEQKQSLGDRLFPLVKATGIKHAPRVTICLLDSIAISKLAHLMYDKQELQRLVNMSYK